MDKAQIDLFKRDLVDLWSKSIELTGVPLDMILIMLFRNATNRGLVANGVMVNVGGQGSFVPDADTLTKWANSYFDAIAQADTAPVPQATAEG